MNSGLFNNKWNVILGGLVLVAAILALLSVTVINLQKTDFLNPVPATISVSGEGEVFAVPDIGEFSFTVNAKADDAATAQEESGTKVNEILAYLKESGIEEKDIKTQNYNLWPQYRWEERICPAGSFCPPGERVEDGFEVSQSISVKVRNTDEAGGIIAGVGERGATNISGLNFTIDDPEALRAEAREAAIKDAKQKAKELARQLGVEIVQLSSYYEDQGYSPTPYFFEARAMSMDASEESFGGAELPMGEESTVVTVNLTYQVK